MKLIDKLNSIVNDKYEVLNAIGELVRDEAKVRVNSNDIRNDLAYELDEDKVRIGTNVFYSVFVHQGTGKYARNGDGTKGYWVYVKQTSTNVLGPIPPLTGAKHYNTYEEAEETKLFLISKGVPANLIHITAGQQSNPFLENALVENQAVIADKIKEYIKGKL